MSERTSVFPAALAGFELIRREPVSVLIWGAISFALTALPIFLVVGLSGGEIFDFLALFAADAPEPGVELFPWRLWAGIMLAMPIILLGWLFVVTVIYNAVWRAVLEPAQRGFAYIRFGVQEGRTLLILLVLGAIYYIAASIAASIATLPVMGMMMTQMMTLEQAVLPDGSMPPGFMLEFFKGLLPAYGLMFAIQFAVSAVLAWPFLRLALALPMSIDQNRLVVFEGWKFSTGHGWGLWGGYMLLWIAFTVFQCVVYLVPGALVWNQYGALFAGDFESLASLEILASEGFRRSMTLAFWASAVLTFVVTAVSLPLLIAPLARAYRMIANARRELAEPA